MAEKAEREGAGPAKSQGRELNVPPPIVGLIALLFTAAMLWNIAIKGDSMVTIALATAVPFIIGVPIGAGLLRGGGGG